MSLRTKIREYVDGLLTVSDAAVALKEDKANKKTSLTDNSDTYYPSQKAVKTAVDAKSDSGHNHSGVYEPVLGYTPENVANKETSALDTSATKYPCNNVVKTANDLKANDADVVHDTGDETIAGEKTFTGDLLFSGNGSGLAYGSFYGNEIAWTQATAVQNTAYLVSDADIVDGLLNLITHDGSGKLTVTKAGVYSFTFSGVFESSVQNKHVNVGVAIDGTASNIGMVHMESKFANEEEMVVGCGLLDLAINQTVEIFIKCVETGTPNISVDHISLVLIGIGGT